MLKFESMLEQLHAFSKSEDLSPPGMYFLDGTVFSCLGPR